MRFQSYYLLVDSILDNSDHQTPKPVVLHQIMTKAVLTIVPFTLLILVNQNIYDGYEPRHPYDHKDAINMTLSFAFGVDFISKHFR